MNWNPAAFGAHLVRDASATLLDLLVELDDAVFERDRPLPDPEQCRDGPHKVLCRASPSAPGRHGRRVQSTHLVVARADALDLLLLLQHEPLELVQVRVLLPRAVDVEQDRPELLNVLVLRQVQVGAVSAAGRGGTCARTEVEDDERELKRCSCCSWDWISCCVNLGRRLAGVELIAC